MKFLILPFWMVSLIFSVSAQPPDCGENLKDARDGKIYKTVQIGDQCWMGENLNFGTLVNNHNQTDNGIAERSCYNNDIKNCNIYGALYTWNEAMMWETVEGSQGICPDGWHLPTRSEWNELSEYLGSDSAGQKMKVGKDHDPSWDGSNVSGFTALPAGGGYDEYYHRLNSWALFWSSTENAQTRAWFTQLDSYWYPAPPKYINLYQGDYYLKSNGLSVRCMKDNL